MIDVVYRHCGQKETVIFCDRMMGLGFSYACRAGISFGKDDLVIPKAKQALVDEASELVKEYENQYEDGLITRGEKYNKVVDVWSNTTDKVAEEMMKEISSTLDDPTRQVNSVYMMAHSGARGSAAQIRQLAGMRGLMARPSGEIIETPIISNFKEGLTVLEYFNSTHGARKGLADTALKTANSGYLTRRLVDVAQDCVVIEEECGSTNGISIRAIIDGGDVIVPLGERILGRTPAVDVVHPLSGEVIVPAGSLIDEERVEAIDTAGVDHIIARSALTCESRGGICGNCYGRDLARGTSVNVGEAVGVIAAQSIGEPGTQLTMRTFHIGGAAQRGAEVSMIEAAFEATVDLKNRNVVMNSEGMPIVMGRNCELVLMDDQGREKARHRLPYGAKLSVDQGRQGRARPKAGRVGPLHDSDHHGKAGHSPLCRHGRRRVDARGHGRNDRHLVEGGGRLAPATARRPAQATRHLARRYRRGRDIAQRSGGPLLHVGRRDLVGREWGGGSGR